MLETNADPASDRNGSTDTHGYKPTTENGDNRPSGGQGGGSPMKSSQKGPSIDDFIIIRTLGSGAYGEVQLVQKKSNSKQYAMKVIDKNFLRREQKEYQVYAEKEVLSKLNHPGVVKLFFAFQDKHKLYFVMEFLAGGDFSEYLKTTRNLLGGLPEKAIKFYAAELVLILEYIHRNGIAHRDVKPENLMLTGTGHLKLIDFGTAKYFTVDKRASDMFAKKKKSTFLPPDEKEEEKKAERRSTFVGTALYVSPELLERNECSAPADLWALGCIIFIMTTGKVPFKVENEYLLFQQIKQLNIDWPSEMDPEAKDLIEKLMRKNPDERLGAGPDGSDNDYEALKRHPFFKEIDFETIFEMETLPFPLPTITSKRSSKMIDDLPVEMIFSQNSGSQVLDLVLEISPRDNPEGAKEIPKEPKVILSGKVDKRSPYWYYQKRNLVLTDEPKLKYYDAKTNKYKNEVPISDKLRAQVASKSKFYVIIPTRKYTFKSYDHPATKWVDAINEAISTLKNKS